MKREPTKNGPYEYRSPEGAPNVRFISSKVQAQAALEEYSRTLKALFNQSVQMLLLAKNASVTYHAREQIRPLLLDTQRLAEKLVGCSQAARGIHTSGNLFRYLCHLLEKADQQPTVDVFYEIASVVEVLAEGFDAARVS